MLKKIGWTILLCGLISYTPTYAESKDDLFKKVFGNKPQHKTLTYDIVLVIDKVPKGEFKVKYNSKDNEIYFNAPLLIYKLRPLISTNGLSQLNISKKNNTLSSQTLTKLGFKVSFSRKNLLATLSTPTKWRKKVVINLSPEPIDYSLFNSDKSNLSGFINFRPRYYLNSLSNQNDYSNLDLESKITMKGWTLENQGIYEPQNGGTYAINDLKLLKLNIENQTAKKIGFLKTPGTKGFLFRNSILGLGVEKVWDMQPDYYLVSPIQKDIQLKKESNVHIILNQRRIRSYELDAGKYLFKRFPFSAGKNNVTIQIKEGTKPTKNISFTYIKDHKLVYPNKKEFSYYAGYKLSENEAITTKGKPFVVSVMQRRGKTKKWTLGEFVQVDQKAVLGLTSTYATSYGLLESDVGASNVNIKDDIAFQQRLTGYIQPNKRIENYSLDFGYKGASFLKDSTDPFNNYSFSGGAGLFLRSSPKTLWYARQAYQWGRGNQSDISSTFISATRYLNAFQLRLSWQYRQLTSGENDWNTLLTVKYFPNFSRQNIEIRRDTTKETTDINYTYRTRNNHIINTNSRFTNASDYQVNSQLHYNKLLTQLSVSELQGKKPVRGFLSYESQRADTRVSFSGNDLNINQKTIEFGSAIAYADGVFAISKPIDNSFVIFYPHKSLKGSKIMFRESSINKLGPAVISDIQPFRVNQVIIQDADIPRGSDLGSRQFKISPSYGSGQAIQIGSEGSIFLTGNLVDKKNQALSLVAGEIISKDGTLKKEFFTNSEGIFQIMGLKHGKYTLVFYQDSLESFTINIPAKTKHQFNVGKKVVNSL